VCVCVYVCASTCLQPSELEQVRSREQRIQDERALIKRLFPTGWQNVGDMCVLERDDDKVREGQGKGEG